jgi:UPF0716 protein FxsA
VVAFLVLLFVIVPLAELAVIIKIGSWLGVGETLGLLLLISILGAWLVKRQGVGVIRRIQAQVNAGQVPGVELVDGALLLIAGALLLFPGFITDAIGLLLLVPPVRLGIRRFARRRLTRRVTRPVVEIRRWTTGPASRRPGAPSDSAAEQLGGDRALGPPRPDAGRFEA